MRNERFTLETMASVATGTAQRFDDYLYGAVHIKGTFVASVDIEISLDGTNYVKYGSSITTPTLVALPNHAIYSVRTRTTAFTSGTPSAVLAGMNARAL